MTPPTKADLLLSVRLHAGSWDVDASGPGFTFHEGGSNTAWTPRARRNLDIALDRAFEAWDRYLQSKDDSPRPDLEGTGG